MWARANIHVGPRLRRTMEPWGLAMMDSCGISTRQRYLQDSEQIIAWMYEHIQKCKATYGKVLLHRQIKANYVWEGLLLPKHNWLWFFILGMYSYPAVNLFWIGKAHLWAWYLEIENNEDTMWVDEDGLLLHQHMPMILWPLFSGFQTRGLI